MPKALNLISLLLKIATTVLGGLTASDAMVVHLDIHTLGAIVSGLGSAALVVKFLQSKTSPPTVNQ